MKPIKAKKFLSTSVEKTFLNIFSHELDTLSIDGCKANLNLFLLRIDSNDFTYEDLQNELYEAVMKYAIPRKQYNAYIESEKYGRLFVKATDNLRNSKSNDGEAGEILLYCLLESHFDAPKLLTKLELKTSGNDYVKGADGVHIKRFDTSYFQLIFGESKMVASLTSAITDALNSINELITRDNNNLEHEIALINSNLFKECNSDEQYEFIKSIVMPKPDTDGLEEHIKKDNAFGIFIGYDANITESEKLLSREEFDETVKKRIIEETISKSKHIQAKINELKLTGYNFYVYIVPFSNLNTTRKRIIRRLKRD